ncbi:MAG: ABC transporter permease [Chloroflexota bacterium]
MADQTAISTRPAATAAESRGGSQTRSVLASVGPRLLSVLLLFALWHVISWLVTTDVVPTPLMTIGTFSTALEDGYIWSDLAITFGRMLGAFALAMLIGVALGAALGTVGWFARIFDLWVTIGASIPSLLYIVVIYLWLGLNDTAAIVGGALVVAPSVTFNVWQGMKSIDPGLSEMARAFNVDRWTTFRRVLLPQTVPFLFAAARLGLALTWKIIIFVELLGRSSGVGYRIEHWFQLFNMRRVLASALVFLVVMLIIELVVMRNLERALFRWRREEAR